MTWYDIWIATRPVVLGYLFGVIVGVAYIVAAEPAKTLVLPDDPGLWICVNTDAGRTCQTQDQVKVWMLENGVRDDEP